MSDADIYSGISLKDIRNGNVPLVLGVLSIITSFVSVGFLLGFLGSYLGL